MDNVIYTLFGFTLCYEWSLNDNTRFTLQFMLTNFGVNCSFTIFHVDGPHVMTLLFDTCTCRVSKTPMRMERIN